MKIYVPLNKFISAVVMIGIIVIQGIIAYNFIANPSMYSKEAYLRFVSWICVVSFVIELIIWNRISGEKISPYIIFIFVAFIFCCGQSIGWAFGIDMGPKDMWDRVDHGMTKTLLVKGLCYSMIGLSCFHLGAILFHSNNTRVSKWSRNEILNSYASLGNIMLLIAIPAFIAKTVLEVIAVSSGGYGAVYSMESSAFTSLLGILSNYYQPCLLILLISNRDKKIQRRIIVAAMLLDVVAELYIGGRSGAVMTLLGIVVTYHYFIKKFRIRDILLLLVAGYIVVALLNSVAVIRDQSGRGLSSAFSANASNNVLGTFIGELGWSITSICWTMNLVPSSYPFRHGMSYLVALISWIPTVIFGSVHPSSTWGELANWLQKALKMGYGPGYTMVAESYINFGWFGIIFLFFEGAVLVNLLSRVSIDDTENNILGATFQILIIMTVMKALVRSSVDQATRMVVFVLLPLYIMIVAAIIIKRRKEQKL